MKLFTCWMKSKEEPKALEGILWKIYVFLRIEKKKPVQGWTNKKIELKTPEAYPFSIPLKRKNLKGKKNAEFPWNLTEMGTALTFEMKRAGKWNRREWEQQTSEFLLSFNSQKCKLNGNLKKSY